MRLLELVQWRRSRNGPEQKQSSAEPAVVELLARADSARDRGEWGLAASLYAEFLHDSPLDFAVWVQRGHAEKERGDFRAAEGCYEAARDLDSLNADLWLQFGHFYKLSKRIGDAKAAYAMCLSLDADNEDARRELGILNLEFPSTAVAHIDEPRAWSPKEDTAANSSAYPISELEFVDEPMICTRIVIAETEGRYEEAAVMSRLLLQRYPLDFERWNRLADLLQMIGRFNEAERCRKIALSVDSKMTDYLVAAE